MIQSHLLAQTNSPSEWVDPDTGHRVVQLSVEPGSESLYFNLNPFTPDGKRMVITSPSGISLINLQTHAVEKIASGRLHIIMVGHKTGQIYYVASQVENGATNRWVCSIDPGTKAIRQIMKLPRGQEVSTVNADETLLGGTVIERNDWVTNGSFFDGGPNRLTDVQSADVRRGAKGTMMEERLAKHYPMQLFFYNIATGKMKTFNRCTDWLGHLQFSPTDPHLMMFCHEGPWHKVDRIWTIHTDGSGLKLIHQRTMIMEIAGHEFFSADGQTIWYDLQTPRGEDFWVRATVSKPARAPGTICCVTNGRCISTSRLITNYFPVMAAMTRWLRTPTTANGFTCSVREWSRTDLTGILIQKT